jgi:hypothetical protein
MTLFLAAPNFIWVMGQALSVVAVYKIWKHFYLELVVAGKSEFGG